MIGFRRVNVAMIAVAHAFTAFAQGVDAQSVALLSGAVADVRTGIPLRDVAVYVDGNNLVGRTDEAGEFSLKQVPPGAYVLHFIKDGYVPTSSQFTLMDGITGEIDLGLIMLTQGSPPSLDITGSVTDAVSGQGVVATQVTINEYRMTFTGDGGAFRIAAPELRWGLNHLQFRRVGYRMLNADVWLVHHDSILDLDVALTPLAVRMPEVVVEGERTTYAYGPLRQMYRRKRVGFGEVFSRADIERIRPIFVSSLLKRMAGVTAVPDGAGGTTVRMWARGGFACSPRIYLNGIRIRGLDIDMYLPDQLEGLEVYTGPSQIPPEFNATGSVCGVVLFWTR